MGEALITRRGGGGGLKKVCDVTVTRADYPRLTINTNEITPYMVNDKLYRIEGVYTDSQKIHFITFYFSYSSKLKKYTTSASSAGMGCIERSTNYTTQITNGAGLNASWNNGTITLQTSNTQNHFWPAESSSFAMYEVEV